MLTIKMLGDIEKLDQEARMPKGLIEVLEDTFKEIHEALNPEIGLNQFSLEMHGPIYVLEKGLDNLVDLAKIGLYPKKNRIMGYKPEWVERINLNDCRFWRIGVMSDNDYLFQVIILADAFGQVVDQWLREYLDDDELLTRPYSRRSDKAEAN